MATKKLDPHTVDLLKNLVEKYWDEERSTRERQLRMYRRLKLFWDGMSRIWYSEVAHDWRAWDNNLSAVSDNDGQQEYYDKPINIFRAYLESVIAALSILVPPLEGYPDDADNPLDLETAKAAKKICELLYRQNNVQLKWINALFIYMTEGMIACYNYVDEDEKYGTYEEKKYEDYVQEHEYTICTNCQAQIADTITNESLKYEYDPDNADVNMQVALTQEEQELCPQCMQIVNPEIRQETLIVEKLVGKTSKPKSRQCMEMYGGLYVKIPNYAKKQCDCPYLILSYESHYALVRARYPDKWKEVMPTPGVTEGYEQWARMNLQYKGDYPTDTVTVRNAWIRCEAFYALNDDTDIKFLKKKFPNGVKVELVGTEIVDYCNEDLDDHWTLSYNPLSDYLQHDPVGLLLTSIQELTNDMFSLVQQTIEHGIPQTFADPAVVNFNQYGQLEASPGTIISATPKGGKTMGDAFYEVRTASLSPEVMPFMGEIQSMGQLVSGAQASLFGGEIGGSKTASEYSMSRAQALQRQQNTWKMLCSFWKEIFSKMVPAYIKEVRDDERYVEKDSNGNFVNTFIRRAELEGKLGSIELEANENLPISWTQLRDVVNQLLQSTNPQILQLLNVPENLPLLYEAMGLTDLYIPGMDERNKQYTEIKTLLETQPMPQEIQEGEEEAAQLAGLPPPEPETSSVPVDEFDNHGIELQICIKWINSPAGQLAKIENPEGYRNVVLHAKEHKLMIMSESMPPPQDGQGAAPSERKKETDQEAPIMEESNVPTAV